MRPLAFDMRNEADAAGIMFVAGPIEPFHPLSPRVLKRK
jgi:hypothetical protein